MIAALAAAVRDRLTPGQLQLSRMPKPCLVGRLEETSGVILVPSGWLDASELLKACTPLKKTDWVSSWAG
jgi:hypothetical protein